MTNDNVKKLYQMGVAAHAYIYACSNGQQVKSTEPTINYLQGNKEVCTIRIKLKCLR